jgi:hypothetical protein
MMSDDDDELDGKVDEKTINADEIIKTMAKGTWGGKTAWYWRQTAGLRPKERHAEHHDARVEGDLPPGSTGPCQRVDPACDGGRERGCAHRPRSRRCLIAGLVEQRNQSKAA